MARRRHVRKTRTNPAPAKPEEWNIQNAAVTLIVWFLASTVHWPVQKLLICSNFGLQYISLLLSVDEPQKFNLPNQITILRLFTAIFTCIFFEKLSVYLQCILCFIIFAADFLDGYVARRFNLATEFGAFLDTQSDMVVTCLVSTFLCVHQVIVWPLAYHMAIAPYVYVLTVHFCFNREWRTFVNPYARTLAGLCAIFVVLGLIATLMEYSEEGQYLANAGAFINLCSFSIDYFQMLLYFFGFTSSLSKKLS